MEMRKGVLLMVSAVMAVMVGVGVMMLGVPGVTFATDEIGRPTGLSASVESNGVGLSWTAPTEGTATGYRILRRRPEEGENRLLVYVSDTGSTATTWTDETVADGVEYVYRVKAISDSAVSASSSKITIRWEALVPDAPSGLSGSVESDGVELSWTAPSGTVTGYQILRRRPKEGEKRLTVYVSDTESTATTWTDTNVSDGVQYVYRVKAVNDAGVGARSNSVKVEWVAPADPPDRSDGTGSDGDGNAADTTEPARPITFGMLYTPWRYNRDEPVGVGRLGMSGLVPDSDSSTTDYEIEFKMLDSDDEEATRCYESGFGTQVLTTVRDDSTWQHTIEVKRGCPGGSYDVTVDVYEIDGETKTHVKAGKVTIDV